MPLQVAPNLQIPDNELQLRFVRSAGPGGQNVNKVATAVQLRFDVSGSRSLSEPVKARLRSLSGQRLNAKGELLILARTQRTQEGNRRDAQGRLVALIRRALPEPKKRTATAPTRASRERRLSHKTRTGRTKQLRGRPGWNE